LQLATQEDALYTNKVYGLYVYMKIVVTHLALLAYFIFYDVYVKPSWRQIQQKGRAERSRLGERKKRKRSKVLSHVTEVEKSIENINCNDDDYIKLIMFRSEKGCDQNTRENWNKII